MIAVSNHAYLTSKFIFITSSKLNSTTRFSLYQLTNSLKIELSIKRKGKVFITQIKTLKELQTLLILLRMLNYHTVNNNSDKEAILIDILDKQYCKVNEEE